MQEIPQYLKDAAEKYALKFVPPEEKWKGYDQIEFLKRQSSFTAGALSPEAARYAIDKLVDVPEITVEEFYTNTFNLSFLTSEEIQTIYTATELYARGKVRAALSRYAGEGGMKWVLKEQLTDIRNNLYENMPAGNVQAWDLIVIIRNHLEKLDSYIDSLPEPPLATTTG